MDGALGLEKWSQCRSALNLKPWSNLISTVHTSTNLPSLAKLQTINKKQKADDAGGWLLGGTYFTFGCKDSWLKNSWCKNINCHYKVIQPRTLLSRRFFYEWGGCVVSSRASGGLILCSRGFISYQEAFQKQCRASTVVKKATLLNLTFRKVVIFDY